MQGIADPWTRVQIPVRAPPISLNHMPDLYHEASGLNKSPGNN